MSVQQPLIQGPLRAGKRTKELVQRLKPGDVALIHHKDLDATAAAALAEARPAAVLNVVPSISGRYPNRGPSVLLEEGIPLIDAVGEEFFAAALERDGALVVIDHDRARLADGTCARGVRLTPELVAEQMAAARGNLGAELQAFAKNTLEYMTDEMSLLLDPVHLPQVQTPIAGRHVMVVVRGEGYKHDLRAIREYVDEVRPVLIGVDGGADALLEAGLKPHIILGDMDSVSDETLRCGAEIIVHGYARGDRKAPGLARMEALGIPAQVFHVPGTSEDVAILLADEKGASLIVAVGTHFSLEEFLDKGRGGMASTFLVRLRTGAKLVDAKGVGRLRGARTRPSTGEILLLVAAALFPILVVAVYSPWFRTVLNTLRLAISGR
jgi:uncharacterized membrane-anchored protein